MSAKRKEIPANLFRPDKETCLSAISCALLKIRADYHVTGKELARIAECGPDAIYAATNEHHLLSFDSIALLCDAFPEECAPIRALLAGGIAPRPTISDRIERMERDLAAMRAEVAA